MTTIRSSTRKARKEHFCDLCRLPISKGTSYESRTNVDSGWIYNFKAHPRCLSLLSELGDEYVEWDSLSFREHLLSYLDENEDSSARRYAQIIVDIWAAQSNKANQKQVKEGTS